MRKAPQRKEVKEEPLTIEGDTLRRTRSTPCHTLLYTATYYNTLISHTQQHAATQSDHRKPPPPPLHTRQHTANRSSPTQRNILQNSRFVGFTHCHTLPHTATYCHMLPHTHLQHTATHCNTLQHTRFVGCTHCHKLQHTATYCNILQHTYCFGQAKAEEELEEGERLGG